MYCYANFSIVFGPIFFFWGGGQKSLRGELLQGEPPALCG